VPIAPRRTKFIEAPTENAFDDVLMERYRHGKPGEQAEILRKFNIIQIESPPNLNNSNIVEIDLASDSEDEAGRFSDGSSIHIEDAMEVDPDTTTDCGNNVGTDPHRKDSSVDLTNMKTRKNANDQELINQIVNKDLETIGSKKMEKGNDENTNDFNLEEEDIVILSDEELVK